MKKTVFITGAARGIGRAAALAFATEGYHVAINAVSRTDLLSSLQEEIEALGVSCLSFHGDISDPAFVKQVFLEIKEKFGRLDVLVNNAGISYVGLLTDMSNEQWSRILNVNLSSVFYCCKEAIPLFLANRTYTQEAEKNGTIINVSSIWGVAGASCEVAYSATKGGINSFTKALAKELAPSQIPVNAVAFGVIDTDMNRCFSEEERDALAEEIPAGRFATPEEAASMLLRLAKADSYLTGQVICYDGGYL